MNTSQRGDWSLQEAEDAAIRTGAIAKTAEVIEKKLLSIEPGQEAFPKAFLARRSIAQAKTLLKEAAAVLREN